VSEHNQKILVVDDNSDHLSLMQQGLSLQYNARVDIACHPEEALDLIKATEDPFPVIWSDYNYKNSKINGLKFLAEVSRLSPLSSRLLCSAQYSEREMIELVRNEEIHSYAVKPVNLEEVAGSTGIGISYYRLNLMQSSFEDVALTLGEGLEEFVDHFVKPNKLYEQLIAQGVESHSHDTELNLLSIKSRALIQRCQDTIQRYNSSTAQRNVDAQSRDKRIQKTAVKAEQRDKLIQQLKDEWL
jgi:response regulator RpfG family c-di-GMP phosphodiesterase